MKALMKLLDWKLLVGSHDFPGPSGGTCINEAALVVAGFAYKKVMSAADMPECFSKPISAYLIGLNDSLGHTERQELIKYVTRLAGSADTPAIEFERTQLMLMRTVKELFAPTLAAAGLTKEAKKCAEATTLDDLAPLLGMVGGAWISVGAHLLTLADDLLFTAFIRHRSGIASQSCIPCAQIAQAGTAIATYYASRFGPNLLTSQIVTSIRIDILESALAIGKQAEPIEGCLIEERVIKTKALAVEAQAARAALLVGV